MNPSQVLETLKVGDRFTTQRVHEVVETANGYVRTKDVNNDEIRFGVPIKADHGSLSVVDVQYAKHKPKVGDELTADEVRAHQWKRGTVLTGNGYTFVLTSEGDWFSPGKLAPSPWRADPYDGETRVTFADLHDELDGAALTVVHLP